MYRTDFWTLWEKARVGCFEITACVLSIVKQITSPGGMHETSAWAWYTGKTQRNRVEREVGGWSGWGVHLTPWLIHVNVWQNPLQCCEVISLQLIKLMGKKKGQRACVHTSKSSLPPSQKAEVSKKGMISFVYDPMSDLEIHYSYARLKFP